MKNKVLSWLSYLLIGTIIQCFAIMHMCDVRGSFEIGGEFLILPAMILIRIAMEDAIGEKANE
ncbi:MAG: hypothetical protein ACI4EO_07770 [Blautia sp.]